MAEKKGERLKLILVFGLSVVLAVSVYFRFIHAKASTGTAPPTPVGLDRPVIVPQVQVKGDASQKEDRETPLLDLLTAPARDIFSPQTPPTPKRIEVQLPEPEVKKPPPTFALKGTISGGNRSIAIIDGRFVRPGDRIGDYQVAWIGKKEVVLESEGKRITLEIMKNE